MSGGGWFRIVNVGRPALPEYAVEPVAREAGVFSDWTLMASGAQMFTRTRALAWASLLEESARQNGHPIIPPLVVRGKGDVDRRAFESVSASSEEVENVVRWLLRGHDIAGDEYWVSCDCRVLERGTARPVVQAHHAFDAALWFAKLEAGDLDATREVLRRGCVVLPTDAEMREAEKELVKRRFPSLFRTPEEEAFERKVGGLFKRAFMTRDSHEKAALMLEYERLKAKGPGR